MASTRQKSEYPNNYKMIRLQGCVSNHEFHAEEKPMKKMTKGRAGWVLGSSNKCRKNTFQNLNFGRNQQHLLTQWR
jgi:hypothetical protein